MAKLSMLVLISTVASSAAAATGPLPFIRDDYATARAEANRRHVPLFVDVWAPW
jgi:hypothetical protein